MPPRKRLGQLLTELGVVDEHQLQSALGHQKQWGGKLGAILVQKGFCKEEEVVSALSRHLGMPRVRLADQQVDPRAIKFVSKPIAEKLHVFAYEVTGSGRSEVVTIAMSDPTDLSAVDQLAFHTGKRIKPMLAGDSEIVSAIAEHYGADEQARPAPTAPAAAPPSVQPAQAGPFPRRVEPSFTRTPPGVPRMTPVMTPVWSAPKPEVQPPTPAPRSQVDLPAADPDDNLALEPIAAHTQTEAVQGQADVSGGGSAADTVEGLEPAGNAQAAAQENWSSGGWESGASWGGQPAAPSQDWAAPPAEALPDWGDEPAHAEWGAPPEEAAQESGHGELQHAPEGAAHGNDAEALPEDVAHDAELPEELPQEALPEETAHEALPEETPQEALPEDAAYEHHFDEIEPAADPAEGEAQAGGEQLPVDAILGTAEEAHPEFSAEHGAEAGESTEAPDAWGATEDPLAAHGAPEWGESAASEGAADAFAEASHEGFDAAQHASHEFEGAQQASHDFDGAQQASHEGFEGAQDAAHGEDHADEQGFDIEESEPAADEHPEPEWGTAEASPAEETATETVAAGDATVETDAVAEESAPSDQPADFSDTAAEGHADSSYAPAEEHAAAPYEPAEGHADAPYEPAEEHPDASYAADEHADASHAPAEEHPATPYEPAATAYAADDSEAQPAEPPTAPVFGMVAEDEPAQAPMHDSEQPPAELEADVAAEDAAAGAEDAGDVPLEWSEPPHTEGFHAEPVSSALSVADATTLASLGIDPHDGLGALRLLASLVRALDRKGLLEVGELAAEVHESRTQEGHPPDDVPPV